MPPQERVLDRIGHTPLSELRPLDTGPGRVLVKPENQNPAGSIKGRSGRSMIQAAERDGTFKPRGTLLDLIVRGLTEGSVAKLAPADDLLHADRRGKRYERLQLPVMHGEQVVGIVVEPDVRAQVHDDPARLAFLNHCRQQPG